MDYWSTNHNKKQDRKNLSIEYKKPIFQSENNDNEQKSKNSNINNETLNLFKGIVKVTKKSLKEKKTPETQSNTVNNNNNIFDFANSVYNNEEHLYDDKIFFKSKVLKIVIQQKVIMLYHYLLLLNQRTEYLIRKVYLIKIINNYLFIVIITQ